MAFDSFKKFLSGEDKKEDPVSRPAAVRAAANEEIQKMLKNDPSLLNDVQQLEQDNPDLTDGKKAA